MKKYIISWVLGAGIFFGFAGVALGVVSSVSQVGAGGSGGGAAASAYAATGRMITNTDLGVTDVGMLPTSSFYFFKEWKRGLSRAFTWNAIKEAELELRIANEKAAEALKVEEENPGNEEAIKEAIENYTEAHDRLQARLVDVKGNSENPNTQVLLEKLDKQSLAHATLFGQIATRWNTDPYVEDVARNGVKPDAVRDNHLQGAVDILQKNIQTTVVVGVEKEKNIKEKAEQQIKRAESELALLKVELGKFMVTASVTNSTRVNEPLIQGSNESRGASDSSEGKAVVRIDNTPARISTNLTIARQTPKRDFGDRMKAGLDQAGGVLANGKVAFAEGKFGEAFGQARRAEVMARNLRSAIVEFAIKEQGVKKVVEPGKPQYEDINTKNKNPLYNDRGSAGTNPLHEEKKDALKACGPQPGAPGNWVCKDGKWQVVTKPTPRPDEQRACTQEAKLCPDGSSVGRTGPRCEFAECPTLKPREGMMCTAQYDPVCGADGKTYSNSCTAGVAGVNVVAKGECATTSSSSPGAMIKMEADGSVYR